MHVAAATFLILCVIVAGAGCLAMPRVGVRLALAAVVLILTFKVFTNVPHDPGVGHALGEAYLIIMLILGVTIIGLLLFTMRISGRDRQAEPGSSWLSRADPWLAGLFMVPVAGIIALGLGYLLAGSDAPLQYHLVLLAVCAGLASGAVWRLRRLLRGAFAGLALALALIVGGSMKMERPFAEAMMRSAGRDPSCLMTGPDGKPPDALRPLMGLTAPKPILLVVGDGDRMRVYRWSFRYQGFVRTNPASKTILCTPVAP